MCTKMQLRVSEKDLKSQTLRIVILFLIHVSHLENNLKRFIIVVKMLYLCHQI